MVWEITRLLQDAESLEEALRTSLGEVVKAVGAEAGTIWFYNSKGDKRIYPSFTIGGADLTGMSLAEGEGIAGQVVKEGKTTVVKDCQSDARWAGRFDESTGFVTKSMVCVPLINKYEVIGCIQIINKKDGSLYNDADVDLCETLAMLTAIAIDDKGLNLGFAEEKKSIISLRGVTKVFGQGDTQIQILKGVNLDVREGEFLVILGESGCGKSTMLNIIGGMDKLTGGSIMKNHGTLDKFVGDCTMAIWNAPIEQEDYVMNACKAAVDMVEGSKALSQELLEKFGRTVSFGIGVHCGSAVVGNIGAKMRMDFTAIGDTVNTSARLEANAPAGKIYISREVVDRLGSRILTTSLGDGISLKGKSNKFEIFLLDGIAEG